MSGDRLYRGASIAWPISKRWGCPLPHGTSSAYSDQQNLDLECLDYNGESTIVTSALAETSDYLQSLFRQIDLTDSDRLNQPLILTCSDLVYDTDDVTPNS